MKLTLKYAIVAILLMLSFAAPVVASPLEDAVAADNRGDYATALQLYQPLADKGDPTAQTNVGFIYANGQGVPQNYAEAVKWFRLAADQGSAYAQLNLGVMYANGQGVPQDYVAAYKWFSLSATQGNTEAVKGRDNIVPLMTPAQIAEVQKLVPTQQMRMPAHTTDSNSPTARYAATKATADKFAQRAKEVQERLIQSQIDFIRSQVDMARKQMQSACRRVDAAVGKCDRCTSTMNNEECEDYKSGRERCFAERWSTNEFMPKNQYDHPYRENCPGYGIDVSESAVKAAARNAKQAQIRLDKLQAELDQKTTESQRR